MSCKGGSVGAKVMMTKMKMMMMLMVMLLLVRLFAEEKKEKVLQNTSTHTTILFFTQLPSVLFFYTLLRLHLLLGQVFDGQHIFPVVV